jgi:vitamin B12 transporter
MKKNTVISEIGMALCVLGLLLNETARASETDAFDMERIVVTASRTPERRGETGRLIDVITADKMEDLQANNIADALSGFSSININSYGGPGTTKSVRMRGATASQVLVLVDGRPITSPRDGEVDLSSIPVDNIERIEVLRGPASSLYGSAAMGGTLNIITKKPPLEGRATELSSSFGTFRTYQERFTHGQKIKNFGYILSSGYFKSKGIRDNSECDANDMSLRLEQDVTDSQKISVSTGFYRSHSGTPGLVTSVDLDDEQKVRKHFIDADWTFRLDPDTNISFKAYNNYDRLEFMENTAGSIFDTAFAKSIHTTQARGLDLQADKRFNKLWRAVIGTNYVINTNDSTDTSKHHTTVLAGYLDNEFNISERLNTRLGVRLDRYSNFGLEPSPNVSALYRLDNKNKIHGLIGRSFRAPTFNDLYWPDQGWSRGNPNLKPEKGTTGELGLTTQIHERLSTDLTYFRSFYDDLIQWAPESADPLAAWTPSNVSSAIIEGVEMESRFSVTPDITLTTGYTFQNAKDEKTGKFLIYQPRHRAVFSLEYINIFGWKTGLSGQWTGLKYHDADNTVKLDTFFTLGLHASKKWKCGLTYFLSIKNALNKPYDSIRNYPAPGFDLTSGLKYEF